MPAVVREADDRDSLVLGLVENVAREQLSPVEEARAYAVLLDEFELSLGEVAERVGRSKPTVSNRLRLLELPDDVLAMVERGSSPRATRAPCSPSPTRRAARLARKIVRRGCPYARPSAPHAGPARRRSRAASRAGRSGLAARVRALLRLTGLEARVARQGRDRVRRRARPRGAREALERL